MCWKKLGIYFWILGSDAIFCTLNNTPLPTQTVFLMQRYFHHEPCFVCLGVYYLNRSASVLEVCGVLVFNAGMSFRVRGG